jgi:anti-anti-sigma factor
MPSRSEPPHFRVDIEDNQAVIRILCRHFGTADGEFPGDGLIPLIEATAQPQIALDFRQVYFLSSFGLTLLLTLHKRLAASGRRLTLFNLQPHVYEVFSVTRLNSVLDVRPQEAAA